MGEGEKRLAQVRVAAETLGAGDEPEVELVFGGGKVGEEFGVVAIRVVDEIAGMDLEKPGKEKTSGVGEMRTGAALDLREIGLADGGFAVAVGLDGADELLLGHGAIEAAEAAFDFTEIPNFVAELHGYCRSQYAIFVKRIYSQKRVLTKNLRDFAAARMHRRIA